MGLGGISKTSPKITLQSLDTGKMGGYCGWVATCYLVVFCYYTCRALPSGRGHLVSIIALGSYFVSERCFRMSRRARRWAQQSSPSACRSGIPRGSIPLAHLLPIVTKVLCLPLNSISLQPFGSLETFRSEAGRQVGGMDNSFSLMQGRG